MSTLDEVLKFYENTNPTTEELPRTQTDEETELLSDYVLNGNQQSIYDYYELKERLDQEWVDRQMYSDKFPWG